MSMHGSFLIRKLGLLLAFVLPLFAGYSVDAAAQQIHWQGIVFTSDPAREEFRTLSLSDGATAGATLEERYEVACPPGVADCDSYRIELRVYPSNGLHVRGWAAHRYDLTSFADAVVAGRYALHAPGYQTFGYPRNTFIVPFGSQILVVSGDYDAESTIPRFTLPAAPAPRFSPGALVMTKPDTTWNLWTNVKGGSRVFERPTLLGGSFVTIVEQRAQAVAVRTTDGVTGWLRVPAATALTTRISSGTALERFGTAAHIKVVGAKTLPVRAEAGSRAKQIGPVTATDPLLGIGVRGDWVRVVLPTEELGWVRWHYDDQEYLELRYE
ncbi:MAG: SH3 domain-containing protein [Chloroflexi bacterium]|nr:SH3 domain-containing protein [Chloroflexota bacterium]